MSNALLSFPLFCAEFLRIKNKDGEVVPLRLNRTQLDFVKTLDTAIRSEKPVRIMVLKARQLGLSTVMQAFLLWRAITKPGMGGLVVAHQEELTGELFTKIEFMYEHLPEELRLALEAARDSKRTGKKLAWGDPLNSTLYVDHAKNRNLGRSQTFQVAHLSELAFWDDPDRTMFGLLQAMPKTAGSICVIESTANGMGDYFHKMWGRAKRGASGWIPLFYPWFWDETYTRKRTPSDDALTGGELEYAKQFGLSDGQMLWRRDVIRDECDGDEDKFRQEYPGTDTEAFIAAGGTYLGRSALEFYERAVRPPEFTGRWEGNRFVRDEVVWEASPYWVWKRAVPGRTYVVSADVSTGTASDYSAVHVIDAAACEVVASGQLKVDPDELAWDLYRFSRAYNDALIAPERNSVGGQVLKTLIKDIGTVNIYSHVHEERRRPTEVSEYGWSTSVKSRPTMLAGLSAAVRSYSLVCPCARTVDEFKSFIRTENKTRIAEAARSAHDDLVMSLCIGVACRERALAFAPGLPEFRSDDKPVVSSLTGY